MAQQAQPQAPPVVLPKNTGKNIIMNPLQRGNPILDFVRNVGKEYGDIIADYQVGPTTGVLYLSLKYHRLHPEYLPIRIEKMGSAYSTRLLLLLCDVTEHREYIRELTKMCLINNITILVAFSSEEAGHYLTTLKQFEHKPPDMIKERVDKDYTSLLRNSLTSISKVNKTDVETLRTAFGSFANIAKADTARLQNLPGFGQVKVKNIKNAFEKPFRNNATTSLATLLATPSQSQSKGKETHIRPQTQTQTQSQTKKAPAPVPRAPRSPSPVWDIEREFELELDQSQSQSKGKGKEKETEYQTTTKTAPRAPRSPSPVWDIELDVTPPGSPKHPDESRYTDREDNPNWVVDLDAL